MTPLEALSPHPHPWSGLLARDDLRWVDGVLHLVHDDLTPEMARTADIGLVADALAAAGLDPMLAQDDHGGAVIVVDAAEGPAAVRALAAAGADEPLYAKPAGAAARLAVDLPLPDPDGVWGMRLYRPRVSANGSLRYGTAESVRLEAWRRADGLVHAPRANALTRRVIPASDLTPTTVWRHGRSWRTVVGMFDARPHQVTADIDMVFSWVDGSASEFQRQRAAQLEEYVVGEGDDGPARYRHVDELRYALRSVHMYAPWVRRIFIATDSPKPAWLAEHPRVTIVRSEEFFADPSVLPTHNSHAVEAQLHRIDGLAEHFLYSNDDMFFGRPVAPEMFFTAGGLTTFVECDVRIGAGAARSERSGHDNALRVNRALLLERFGRSIVRDLEHCAAPMRRSIAAELEREFAEDIARTAASRFRSASDVSVTNSLYHYYALMTGRAVATTAPRVTYVQTTMVSALRKMRRLEERRDADMFCLNDGGETEVPEEMRVRLLRDTLERMFPVRAPWEVPVSAARTTAASAGRSASARRRP
ncbi:stealth conserved region 3 domain-containing protein [Microbacterium hominis]|uniref:stealth conserved region 3 domain-containing protein n=1 Tax=Microbacterium TaxID=33882 RepID=UPI00168BBB9A|nr:MULTISPECIES: stealth conserved region 3 domain-containing protein [Microbacterium]QOC25069.1 stealth conserved region 3 domain-containing protein [Microbacterium hominis]QOC29114.1 stealth conserved region 3 domain-containing protein [Microbacterium hominis]QYF98670.1 stealth family protein [Microbacterium sp. PAMC21962]